MKKLTVKQIALLLVEKLKCWRAARILRAFGVFGFICFGAFATASPDYPILIALLGTALLGILCFLSFALIFPASDFVEKLYLFHHLYLKKFWKA